MKKTPSGSSLPKLPKSSPEFLTVVNGIPYFPCCSCQLKVSSTTRRHHLSLQLPASTPSTNNRRRSSRQRPADPYATYQPPIGTSKAPYDSTLSSQKKTRGWARLFHMAKWAAAWKALNGGLQICPSSVEFMSVRNMNTGVKRKRE